ncbi:MAG: transposase [Leptospiraceae bacterium]|nr:transposase [Leptospiraceae bacterium]
MDFILNEHSDLFSEYINSFDPLWEGKSKRYFEKTLKGFSSEIKRKNIERISETIIDQDYQNLHHFITTSPWDKKDMNEIRINFMREHSNSYPTKKAILVIDDLVFLKEAIRQKALGINILVKLEKWLMATYS